MVAFRRSFVVVSPFFLAFSFLALLSETTWALTAPYCHNAFQNSLGAKGNGVWHSRTRIFFSSSTATTRDEFKESFTKREAKNYLVAASRRNFLSSLATTFGGGVITFLSSFPLLPKASYAQDLTATSPSLGPVVLPTPRAIGSGEYKCRQEGNCLEVGEFDGAVGWNWGGKDRCDANDPRCGADGILRDSNTPLLGQPVPQLPTRDDHDAVSVTQIVAIRLDVGRTGESGVLKLGLYGQEFPTLVQQFVDLCSAQGLTTMNSQDSLGQVTVPVKLATGGVISSIAPHLTVELGVPSQANAYGRSRGLSRTEEFVPQPRPILDLDQKSIQRGRSHDVAGLLSVPVKGIGYGGTGFESDDEAFERSFLLTARSAPALDKTRRVIGQIIDADSMAFLERLANLPTKKGIKGVIPGQSSGPPFVKAVVKDVAVFAVSASPK